MESPKHVSKCAVLDAAVTQIAAGASWPRFKDEIEQRLRSTAEARKSGVRHCAANTLLASLGTKRRTDFLRQGRGSTEHGRG